MPAKEEDINNWDRENIPAVPGLYIIPNPGNGGNHREDIPYVPPELIINEKRKKQRRQPEEGIPLQLPLEDPFRTPEINHDQNRNPFEINYEIGNHGGVDYSR